MQKFDKLLVLSAVGLLAACAATDGSMDGDGAAGAGAGGGSGGSGGTPNVPPPDVIDDSPVACHAAADAGGFTFVKLATWKDDAKAAYSMIHDDMCGSALAGIQDLAVPQLEAHNLTAALGPFVEACDESGGLWDVVRLAQAQGNEIVNHSYTHPNITPENAARLVQLAKTDPSATVRNQLACTAKRLPVGDGLAIAGALAARDEDANDPFLPMLIWWAIDSPKIPAPMMTTSAVSRLTTASW